MEIRIYFPIEGFSQNGGKECDEENFRRVDEEERSCSTGSCKSKGPQPCQLFSINLLLYVSEIKQTCKFDNFL